MLDVTIVLSFLYVIDSFGGNAYVAPGRGGGVYIYATTNAGIVYLVVFSGVAVI